MATPRKNTTRKTTVLKTTKSPRSSRANKDTRDTKESAETHSPLNTFFDYFRLSETYTSLILGIVVVIIATVLLIAFFKNQQLSGFTKPSQQISYDKIGPSQVPETTVAIVSGEPTATITVAPTSIATPTSTIAPTAAPTSVPSRSTTPTQATTQTNQTQRTYTVKPGDDLWHIAQSQYNDGYQWVAIAKANNLESPNYIHTGDRLVLPKVQTQTASNTTITKGNAISGTTYTIQKGDDLWDIAIRAYGDGYRWVDIAKANGYTNPDLVHSGNVLKIPR